MANNSMKRASIPPTGEGRPGAQPPWRPGSVAYLAGPSEECEDGDSYESIPEGRPWKLIIERPCVVLGIDRKGRALVATHTTGSGKLLNDVPKEDRHNFVEAEQFPDQDTAEKEQTFRLKLVAAGRIKLERSLVHLKALYYVPLPWIQGAWFQPRNAIYFLKESYHRILDQWNFNQAKIGSELPVRYLYCTHNLCSHSQLPVRTVQPSPYCMSIAAMRFGPSRMETAAFTGVMELVGADLMECSGVLVSKAKSFVVLCAFRAYYNTWLINGQVTNSSSLAQRGLLDWQEYKGFFNDCFRDKFKAQVISCEDKLSAVFQGYLQKIREAREEVWPVQSIGNGDINYAFIERAVPIAMLLRIVTDSPAWTS